MSNENIYITIVRTGKQPSTAEVASGATLEDVLRKLELPASDYRTWSFQDEDGGSVQLSTRLHETAHIIVGQRVQGA